MLKREKSINGYNGNWTGEYIGFEGVCPLYRVGRDDDGWYYEYLPGADGKYGYNSPEEAKAAAKADYEADVAEIQQLMEADDEPLSYDEAMEVLGDMLYDERKENELMGW